MQARLILIKGEGMKIHLVAENSAELVILQLVEWDKPTWTLDRTTDSLTANIVVFKPAQEGE